MIKALFFDIDGTLVSFSTHLIPQSAVKAITKAKEKGIRIIVIDAQLDDDTIADTTVLSNNYDAGVQCAKDMMRNLSSAKIVEIALLQRL